MQVVLDTLPAFGSPYASCDARAPSITNLYTASLVRHWILGFCNSDSLATCCPRDSMGWSWAQEKGQHPVEHLITTALKFCSLYPYCKLVVQTILHPMPPRTKYKLKDSLLDILHLKFCSSVGIAEISSTQNWCASQCARYCGIHLNSTRCSNATQTTKTLLFTLYIPTSETPSSLLTECAKYVYLGHTFLVNNAVLYSCGVLDTHFL